MFTRDRSATSVLSVSRHSSRRSVLDVTLRQHASISVDDGDRRLRLPHRSSSASSAGPLAASDGPDSGEAPVFKHTVGWAFCACTVFVVLAVMGACLLVGLNLYPNEPKGVTRGGGGAPRGLSPTSRLSDRDFQRWLTILLWATCVLVGLGSELVVGPMLLRSLSGSQLGSFCRLIQLVFPLCLTIAVMSGNIFGLPWLVFGLYKGGFPETLGYLMDAATALEHRAFAAALPNYLNGVGLVLHHAMTCFSVCGWIQGLFALTRPALAPTCWLIVQHWFMLLKYDYPTTYLVIELGLEAGFEWTLFANLKDISPANGYDRLARPVMLGMLVAHWLYLLASVAEVAWTYGNRAGDEQRLELSSTPSFRTSWTVHGARAAASMSGGRPPSLGTTSDLRKQVTPEDELGV